MSDDTWEMLGKFVLAPVVAWVAISVRNGMTKWKEAHGWRRMFGVLSDGVSFIPRKDSPDSVKSPLTLSKPPAAAADVASEGGNDAP